MAAITITTSDEYINLTAISGIEGSLVVVNTTSHPAYVIVQALQPASEEFGYIAQPAEELYVNNTGKTNVWIKGLTTGTIVVQGIHNSSSECVTANLPQSLYTSSKEGFARIRTDVAQTGFFEGREFRTFFELSIPQGGTQSFKVSCTNNFILFEQSLVVDAGAIRLNAYTSASDGSAYTTNLPIIGKNRLPTRPQPYYTSVMTVQTGGSRTGGTLVETIRVVASNATSQQTSVGGGVSSERGLPAGTYYIDLVNISNGTATGAYSLWWEERP